MKSSPLLDEDINPCLEEAGRVKNCLEDNFYVYSECHNYFENYRNCKKFWGKVRRLRKMNGISPSIPTKAERDKIMKLREEGKNVFSA